MTEGLAFPTRPVDPGFGEWKRLNEAILDAPEEPGLYLIRSRHLGDAHWPAQVSGCERWLAPGVLYVGMSYQLKTRLQQFSRAARSRKTGHPGGYWFAHWIKDFHLYKPVSNDWESDLEISVFLVEGGALARPQDSLRWESARRVWLEGVESAVVADIMAHRVGSKCTWRPLNDVDRTTLLAPPVSLPV